MLKKKTLGQFSKNYRTFYSKNCHYALKSMCLGSEIRDPEKNLFRIPDPGVKKAPDPGSGSATLVLLSLGAGWPGPARDGDQQRCVQLPAATGRERWGGHQPPCPPGRCSRPHRRHGHQPGLSRDTGGEKGGGESGGEINLMPVVCCVGWNVAVLRSCPFWIISRSGWQFCRNLMISQEKL